MKSYKRFVETELNEGLDPDEQVAADVWKITKFKNIIPAKNVSKIIAMAYIDDRRGELTLTQPIMKKLAAADLHVHIKADGRVHFSRMKK